MNLIYDKKIQDWIERYLFCEQFKIRPFKAESYDELPALWIDFCQIMKTEINLCEKEWLRVNGR